ncbi:MULTISPECIES: thiamine phosphate synthase [unclassified Aureimonas]|uniref:thiamine phosphate synthase n=1 Tax=unclassified Aureimonas TaxID=2615206 RepID=UPI0007010D9B|nr:MULTISPECIES: thiamine phosphate synthase [unclassified Aureimonas]KQT52144.1 thiamine-phosphate pyrophosphorylase [Aureimonas sp. Leaf427]KQT70622.1 thiamine-phosphate pyrophosphorylase [Aureimonas sp. Leaf460]
MAKQKKKSAPVAPAFVRPRLVLATTLLPDGEAGERMLRAALSGGDVSSVIFDPAGRDADAFQSFAEPLVALVQDYGAAAIVTDDSRCAGRVQADGLHLTDGDVEALGEAVERYQPRLIVGASGFTTRHDALEAGEKLPDYLMFGRLGGDAEDAADPADLDMAEWWADIVEVPCILLGGGDLSSLKEAAETGAEFICLSRAVFGAPDGAAEAVTQANRVFDELAESVAA